jgi:hypothetical protein
MLRYYTKMQKRKWVYPIVVHVKHVHEGNDAMGPHKVVLLLRKFLEDAR